MNRHCGLGIIFVSKSHSLQDIIGMVLYKNCWKNVAIFEKIIYEEILSMEEFVVRRGFIERMANNLFARIDSFSWLCICQ